MGELRIVDPSTVRLPLRAHYQATVYANATDSVCAIFCVGVIVVYV